MTAAEIFNRELVRHGLGRSVKMHPESPSRKGYDHIRKLAEMNLIQQV
jgi:hypothetical protein